MATKTKKNTKEVSDKKEKTHPLIKGARITEKSALMQKRVFILSMLPRMQIKMNLKKLSILFTE